MTSTPSLEETKREVKLKDLAESLTRPRRYASLSSFLHFENGVRPTRENEISPDQPEKALPAESIRVLSPSQNNIPDGKRGSVAKSTSVNHSESSSFIHRFDLPAEDVLYGKKGWLLKQGPTEGWSKHWFVLEGNGLKFFRDPSAENNGILDGVVDLGMVRDIREKEVGRNYGFIVIMWDDKKLVFSALTSGIRSNWVQAMRTAANLKVESSLGSLSESTMPVIENSKEKSYTRSNMLAGNDSKHSTPSQSSLHNHSKFHDSTELDEEAYMTASEASFLLNEKNCSSVVDSPCGRSLTNDVTGMGLDNDVIKRGLTNDVTGMGLDNDVIKRGLGNDVTGMGLDNDVIKRGLGNDVIKRGLGNDVTRIGLDNDVTRMGLDNDVIKRGLTNDVTRMGLDNDVTRMGLDNDVIKRGLSNDVINGRSKNGSISGRSSGMADGKIQVTSSTRSDLRSSLTMRSRSSPPPSGRSSREDLGFQSSSSSGLSSNTSSTSTLNSCSKFLSETESIYLSRLSDSKYAMPERDLAKNFSVRDEGLIVELLEAEVDSLKSKLEETQMLESNSKSTEREDLLSKSSASSLSLSRVESLRKQLLEERRQWDKQLAVEQSKIKDLKSSQVKHAEITRKLTRSLQEAEMKIASQSQEMAKNCDIKERLREQEELNSNLRLENVKMSQQVLETKDQLRSLQESLKSEKSESYKWKDLVKELRSLLDGRNQDMETKREEISSLREKLKNTQSELNSTADRLSRGIEENESLCERLRVLQREEKSLQQGNSATEKDDNKINSSSTNSKDRFPSSKKSLPRLDSLSDLTNCDLHFDPEELDKDCLVEEFIDLRSRFEKAVDEIRALKKELRLSENVQDETDFTLQRLKSEFSSRQDDFKAQMRLMETRLQDLTNKLATSDKQLRSITKSKSSRSESRERRRTLSLKGRESFTFSKELEVKIADLETKVNALSNGNTSLTSVISSASCCPLKETRRSKSFEESNKKFMKNRRKSLDSQATSSQDALKTVLRLNAIEDKVTTLSGSRPLKKASSSLSLDSCNSTSRGTTPKTKSPIISPASSKKNLSPRSSKSSLVTLEERSSRAKRSESEQRVLKERIGQLENVLNYLQVKLSEGVSCSRTYSCLCNCESADKTHSNLEQILALSLEAAQNRHVPLNRDWSAEDTTHLLATRIHGVLKDKMNQLALRRQELRSSGKWNREAQLKTLTEKLAFEAVLFTQLIPKTCFSQLNSQRLQELIEAHRKLSFLEKKLVDPQFDMSPLTPIEFYTNLLSERLTVSADVYSGLLSQCNSVPTTNKLLDNTCDDLMKKLLERERKMGDLVAEYKEGKLLELARVMARDTVKDTTPEQDESVLVEEVRLREAWIAAQEILNDEIASLETSQSISRLSNLLSRSEVDVISAGCHQTNSDTLERLQLAADDSLRQEMEESVFILSRKYEDALKSYRAGNETAIASPDVRMTDVLTEYASVIAQKALVDGQLAVATVDASDNASDLLAEKSNFEKVDVDTIDAAKDVVASESHLLMFLGGGNNSALQAAIDTAISQAEITYLFNHTASQISREFSCPIPANTILAANKSNALDNTSPAGPSVKKLPSPKPQRRCVDSSPLARKNRRTSDITGMLLDATGGCHQCDELKHDVARLRRVVDSKKTKKQTETQCSKCEEYKCALKQLEEEHRIAMEQLEGQHQTEMDRLRDQVKYDPPTRDSDDELTELKRRLCLLEEGYEAQIAALKKQYSEALGSQSDVCEENIRQRYQLEIEHLRELCEKGLTAMETSHRRVVDELEATHEREMSQLRSEKEEALAEETAATLAALDAMRKAHEAEVLKEVAKFKEEWLRRAEDGQSPTNSLREEQRELREVRTEILALSEKYSSKCLEMAAKEQKIESLQRLLTESKTHIRSLEERNRLLKQRLNSHLSHIQNISKKTPSDFERQHEVEMALKDDQIALLTQTIQKSSSQSSDESTGKETREIFIADGLSSNITDEA